MGHGTRVPGGRRLTDPPESEERLKSGKAVAAALILAGVALAAVLLFLWVLLTRACTPAAAHAPDPAAGVIQVSRERIHERLPLSRRFGPRSGPLKV